VAAVQTYGGLPLFKLCNLKFDEMSLVVISVSAAVPAPQQLQQQCTPPISHSTQLATKHTKIRDKLQKMGFFGKCKSSLVDLWWVINEDCCITEKTEFQMEGGP